MIKRDSLRTWIFLALCSDFGLFAKRLIAPAANIITDALHIPGGIGTSFSLMFLVIGAMLINRFGCATLMSIVQSLMALALGMIGSMGALSPIGYIIPGLFIDCVVSVGARVSGDRLLIAIFANMISAAAASFTANAIVFHLYGIPLLLYISVALFSGAICGLVGGKISERIRPLIEKAQ